MGFYVGIFSMAALAVLVAVLMRWPKQDDTPEHQSPASKQRRP